MTKGESNPNEYSSTLEDGIGICLSGGGYRAMLYHVGALWRLNEVGLLTKADRISSVSGGSITAGWLGLVWARESWPTDGTPIDEKSFCEKFANPILDLAGRWIDVPCVLAGVLPWTSVGEQVAKCYNQILFQGATLQSLPDRPRFVINASNLQTGLLWRFSKPYFGDYLAGRIVNPNLDLATAVAASSAFPPFLSPLRLRLEGRQLEAWPGMEGNEASLCRRPFSTKPILSDGGVYDNLGMETVWKRYRTVLVSDGGGRFKATAKVRGNWPMQMYRVLCCIDNQVRSLRKRQLIESFEDGRRNGCYWGIATSPEAYSTLPLPCKESVAKGLAGISTRLWSIDIEKRKALVNWGYASCAASLATNFTDSGAAPSWPYADAALA
jgi:NTE family protein